MSFFATVDSASSLKRCNADGVVSTSSIVWTLFRFFFALATASFVSTDCVGAITFRIALFRSLRGDSGPGAVLSYS